MHNLRTCARALYEWHTCTLFFCLPEIFPREFFPHIFNQLMTFEIARAREALNVKKKKEKNRGQRRGRGKGKITLCRSLARAREILILHAMALHKSIFTSSLFSSPLNCQSLLHRRDGLETLARARWVS